jgi:hypothetical protein
MRSGGMSILQAMGDPNLFRDHFPGDTWEAWRAYLAALFGLPMSDDQLALYRQHTGRTTPPTEPFKESALIVGRRGGKSRAMAFLAVYLACFRDYKPFLAPGEMATVGIIAADRRQARTIMRYITGAMHSIKLLAPMIDEELSESVMLTNNVVIEIATASFRVTRGYTYCAVVADEISYWRNDNSANPDKEIIAAIRPGMASIPGAMLIMASSPYAKRGVLYDTFKRHYGVDDARVLVWKASSAEMNPALDPAIIAEAYEDDPAAASAEYGAEFRSDISSFCDREVIEACTMPGRHELPPISSHSYCAFVDPSGGSNDSYCVAIAHAERTGTGPDAVTTAVLDAVREYKPPFSPENVTAEIADLVAKYRCRTVTGDRYAGEFPRELFAKRNIEYRLSDRPASEIFRDTLPLLNSGRVELLENNRLAQQLIALERRTVRSGRDSIGHPVGGHDDLAVSVCGAVLLCSGDTITDVVSRWRALSS